MERVRVPGRLHSGRPHEPWGLRSPAPKVQFCKHFLGLLTKPQPLRPFGPLSHFEGHPGTTSLLGVPPPTLPPYFGEGGPGSVWGPQGTPHGEPLVDGGGAKGPCRHGFWSAGSADSGNGTWPSTGSCCSWTDSSSGAPSRSGRTRLDGVRRTSTEVGGSGSTASPPFPGQTGAGVTRTTLWCGLGG